MKRAYQVLAYVLAAQVLIQAMAISYAMAGLFVWVDQDGGVLNKAVLDAPDGLEFRGAGGFAIHGMNGMMIIPVIGLLLLLVSFFAKVQSGVKRATILLLMVVLEVVLGVAGEEEPLLAPLHALNGIGILVMAFLTARGVTTTTPREDAVVV